MLPGVELFTLDEKDPPSASIIALLYNARQRIVLRVTGGSGNVPLSLGRMAMEIIPEAFFDFPGALIFGGTRILLQSNPSVIYPTVQEAAILIKKRSPDVVTLGIIPRTKIFTLIPAIGNVMISHSPELDQFTFIHPEQNTCLQVQKNVDDPTEWDAEWRESKRIIEILCATAKRNPWLPILFSFNGGGVVRREILSWVNFGWPVLLVQGSGRDTDALCLELAGHSAVYIAQCNASSIRQEYENILVKEGCLRNCNLQIQLSKNSSDMNIR